jgi:iron complex transport system substrate-binding protein
MSPSVEGICQDIEFIADMLNVSDRGAALAESLSRQVDAIASVGKAIENKKTVYFEISPAPNLVTIGHNTYLDQFISIVGAENIFSDQIGVIFPGAESILVRNPDVIIAMLGEQYHPVEEIKNRDGFEHITAVQNNEIYLVDANSASRPSARILTALKQMAKAVYPEKYEAL